MLKKTLDDWGRIAEIVSAVAVIISLVYVGYQVNENTGEIRASNRQQLVNRSVDATMSFATNTDIAGVLAKVRTGGELDDKEYTQFSYVVRGVLYDVQEAFLLHREGRLDEGYWSTREKLIVSYLDPPIASHIYEENRLRGVLHPEYIRWLDAVLPKS
jgi:hypothetical protein